ncbi:MAG: hypothetical protein K8Q89_07710 [Nitrosarchaeum sp.]|nr:hypothetical protein [Nitrosarchaeum sp.]
MSIKEIIQAASQLGLRINNLEDLDEKTLKEMRQAIIEYEKNRNNNHIIDYMW